MSFVPDFKPKDTNPIEKIRADSGNIPRTTITARPKPPPPPTEKPKK